MKYIYFLSLHFPIQSKRKHSVAPYNMIQQRKLSYRTYPVTYIKNYYYKFSIFPYTYSFIVTELFSGSHYLILSYRNYPVLNLKLIFTVKLTCKLL